MIIMRAFLTAVGDKFFFWSLFKFYLVSLLKCSWSWFMLNFNVIYCLGEYIIYLICISYMSRYILAEHILIENLVIMRDHSHWNCVVRLNIILRIQPQSRLKTNRFCKFSVWKKNIQKNLKLKKTKSAF